MTRSLSRRALGLAALTSLVVGSAAGGPFASADNPPAVAAATPRTTSVTVRPNGTASAFQVYGAASAAAALDDPVSRSGAPTAADGIRATGAGRSTSVRLAVPRLGGATPVSSTLWYYAGTGDSTTLDVEVLADGVPLARGSVVAGSSRKWRSIAFTPTEADATGLQVRFTNRGGSEADVRAAYATVTAGSTTKVVRPIGTIAPFTVLPSGSAHTAIDDRVSRPDRPGGSDHLHSTAGGRSTTVRLGTTHVGDGTEGATAWFYATTGKHAGLRVEVVSRGTVRASSTVPADRAAGWRSVTIPAASQRTVDDLQLRFVSAGSGTTDVQAAYVSLRVPTEQARVDDYLLGLHPILPTDPEVAGHPVGAPEVQAPTEPLDTQMDPDTMSGQAKFQCDTTAYSSTQSPEQIVIQHPDTDKMWAGSLLQGQGYAGGLGSLQALGTEQRAPLTVSINLNGPHISTVVQHPNNATMQQAVADLILDAKKEGLTIPADVFFDQQSEVSSEEGLTKAGLSAKYLGASVTASLKTARKAQRSALRVSFVQHMFDITIVKPDSPSGYFTNDFGTDDLARMRDRGQLAPDNPPVVISHVSYGRRLFYSVTSTAREDELEGAIDAAYKAGKNGGSVQIDARQQSILNQAEFKALAIGGPESNVEKLIQTHNVQDYFAAPATVDTALPISYQVDNLNGSAARFSETTNYTLRQCRAIPNHQVVTGATVTVTPPKFYLDAGRDHADLFGQLNLDSQSFWDRGRDDYQTVQNHTVTTPTQPGNHTSGTPMHGDGDTFWTRTYEWDPDGAQRPTLHIGGSANCILWFPESGVGSNQYGWDFDVRSGGSGNQDLPGGSRTCNTRLQFNLTKTDMTEWRP